MNDRDILVEEWKDIRESLRYFGNKRFAQLTVFIAISGFMFDSFFKQPDHRVRVVLAIVGLVGSALFVAMEYSSFRYWKSFAERGKKIERDCGVLELMTRYRPTEPRSMGTIASYGLYVLVGALWLLSFWWIALGRPVEVPAVVEKVLASMPTVSGNRNGRWSVRELTWNEPAETYRLLLREQSSGDSTWLVFDTRKGRIVRIEPASSPLPGPGGPAEGTAPAPTASASPATP